MSFVSEAVAQDEPGNRLKLIPADRGYGRADVAKMCLNETDPVTQEDFFASKNSHVLSQPLLRAPDGNCFGVNSMRAWAKQSRRADFTNPMNRSVLEYKVTSETFPDGYTCAPSAVNPWQKPLEYGVSMDVRRMHVRGKKVSSQDTLPPAYYLREVLLPEMKQRRASEFKIIRGDPATQLLLKITALPDELTELTDLRVVQIENTGLKLLPESIGRLNGLTQMFLCDNKLTSLPESIGQLTELKTLNVYENKLTSLPESIGRLAKLETLGMDTNRLTSLPESIGQLTELKSMHVYSNKLTSLPQSIGQMNKLEILYVQDNKLTSLPESIGQLTELKTLNVCDNKLTSLPESIGRLAKLKSLGMDTNRLTSLPESIGRLAKLGILDMDNNMLTSLPESIWQLTELKILNVRNNKLTTLPESIGRLANLETLALDDNKLTSLPESIKNLTELSQLFASGNSSRVTAQIAARNLIPPDSPTSPVYGSAGLESPLPNTFAGREESSDEEGPDSPTNVHSQWDTYVHGGSTYSYPPYP